MKAPCKKDGEQLPDRCRRGAFSYNIIVKENDVSVLHGSKHMSNDLIGWRVCPVAGVYAPKHRLIFHLCCKGKDLFADHALGWSEKMGRGACDGLQGVSSLLQLSG